MQSRELNLPATTLLRWLPGETLFSLCSRQHRFWGHPRAWQTSLLLFDGRHAGAHHDLPNALGELVIRTRGQWGAAEAIATERTLLRYYRVFLPAQATDSAVDCMCSASVAHLKFRLGLLTSRFRANHPLKACPRCMQADVDQHGWAYWHLHHQYPGVWVCPDHGEPLLESMVKSTGVERFNWHLPAPHLLRSWTAPSAAAAPPALTALALLICALVDADADAGWVSATPLEWAIRAEVDTRGWVTPGGSLRTTAMAEDYLHYCNQLRGPSELQALPTTLSDTKAQIGRLLRSIQDGTHPLRILISSAWLFGDITTLHAALDNASVMASKTTPSKPGLARSEVPTVDTRRSQLVELMRAGRSARAAAALIGVDVGTAIAWAAQVGHAVSRRAKVLKPPLITALSADLHRGLGKSAVAQLHGISLPAVTRLLRTEVGLHGAWRRAQQDAAQANARNAWNALLRAHPGVGTTLLRAINPSAYTWLYRHDRVWLQRHSPTTTFANPQLRKRSVDWEERDRWLKAAVERAALELLSARSARRLSLGQICQAVPELKPKLPALRRLPLTSRALERALRQRPLRPKGHDLLR